MLDADVEKSVLHWWWRTRHERDLYGYQLFSAIRSKKLAFTMLFTTPAAAIAMDVTNESQLTSDVIVLDYTPTLSSSLL